MNTKRKILSIVLTLALMAGLIQPCLRTTVLAADTDNQRTFTFESEAFYKSMKEVLAYGNNLNSSLRAMTAAGRLHLIWGKLHGSI